MNFSIKYRPKVLDEVVGHEKIVKELKKRSKNYDFPYVMMFTGKTGVGKTTFQKIIAKNILCKNKDEEGNSCNTCEICKTVDDNRISNYYYEYNASNLGIDDMRQLEEIAIMRSLNPAAGKVIVIDELQEMSANKKAQKNILKLLEKPIKNTYFILGAMNESKVDKAILNRTVKYRLGGLIPQDISKYLVTICTQEGIEIKEENQVNTIVTISENSDQSLRTAVSYLERVINSELWTSESLLNDLGIISQEEINSWINGILSGDNSIFRMTIDVDTLEKINYILLLYLKNLMGIELLSWQKMKLKGIGSFSLDIVKKCFTNLNEYLKYTYTTQYLLDFTIINTFSEIHPVNNSQPTRRRRLES